MSVPTHPIARGWISTGGTGGPNYDEFASDDEVSAAIAGNPHSVLAIEMPHCAPGERRSSVTAALPDAVRRWQELRDDGAVREIADTLAVYRIMARDGVSHGVFCMVDTGQISASAAEPGLVIRNEDVFPTKVRERVALAEALQALLSPVLLLQTVDGLHALLESLVPSLGAPSATDVDAHGYRHDMWEVGPGPVQERLLAAAGAGELIVADGNHRSLAAQQGGLAQFLAVVTTPESVRIAPYHRLVTDLAGRTVAEVCAALEGLGCAVTRDVPIQVPAAGTVVLYSANGCYAVDVTSLASGSVVERLDHAIVENVLFNQVLEFDAGDKRIVYVGGDYPLSWLESQVDSGEATLAVVIAPVAVDDFVAVNLERLKLPRKSTWFVPKARAGLIAAAVA